jgi:hypothetical protein
MEPIFAAMVDEPDLNKERLELVLEAAGLDLWENDLVTGQVTHKATKTFLELGFSEDEIVSGVQDIYGLFHPGDLDMVRQAVADHVNGVTAQYRAEFRLRSKAGEWVWFANYGRIMDRSGATPGKRLIGVTFNINDRKQKEDEIAQINRQLIEQNKLLQEFNTALELLASNDSLTGLANRRTLMELGANECKRSERFDHRGPGLCRTQAQRRGHRGPFWRRGVRHRAARNRRRERPACGRVTAPRGRHHECSHQRRRCLYFRHRQHRCGHPAQRLGAGL